MGSDDDDDDELMKMMIGDRSQLSLTWHLKNKKLNVIEETKSKNDGTLCERRSLQLWA